MFRSCYQSILSFIVGKTSAERIRRYGINTAWIFSQKIFSLGISFVVGVYIARYLGPNGFGLMNYVFSFVGIFASLSGLGVDEILRRELVKGHHQKNELISTGFWIKCLGAAITLLLIFITSYRVHGFGLTHFLIMLYSLTFIFQSFDVFDIFFQSQIQAKHGVHVRIIVSVIGAAIKLFGVWSQQGIVWFIWVYLFESIATGFGLWLSYRYYYVFFVPIHGTKKLAKELLTYSWPLMFSGIAITLYMKFDQVLIGTMLNIGAVGIYAIAVRLSEIWYTIPVALCASIVPVLVRARINNPELYKNYLQKLYAALFWLAFVIAISATLFAHIVIKILFGQAYLAAVPVLQIYIWAGIAVFVGTALAQYLIIENQTKIFFATTLCGGISNIILNIILIPRFGIIGSAIATVISYSLVVISIVFFKQTRKHALFMLRSIVSFH